MSLIDRFALAGMLGEPNPLADAEERKRKRESEAAFMRLENDHRQRARARREEQAEEGKRHSVAEWAAAQLDRRAQEKSAQAASDHHAANRARPNTPSLGG